MQKDSSDFHSGNSVPFATAIPSAPIAIVSNDYLNVPPEIRDVVKEGAKVLSEHDMSHVQARVCAVLDISGSMENPNRFVSTGTLQHLFNQFFSLAILLDDNQEIEVFLLGADNIDYLFYKVTQANYQNFVDMIISQNGLAGQTAYNKPIEQVLCHYFPDGGKMQWKYDDPVFCAFLTDGAPNPEKSGRLAKGLIADAANSGKPIFFKFLALHGQTQNFELLQGIDDDSSRAFDNCDFVDVLEPQSLKMADIINEFRGFILEAKQLGHLESDYQIPAKYLHLEDRVNSSDTSSHFLLNLFCSMATAAGISALAVVLVALSLGSPLSMPAIAIAGAGCALSAVGIFNFSSDSDKCGHQHQSSQTKMRY